MTRRSVALGPFTSPTCGPRTGHVGVSTKEPRLSASTTHAVQTYPTTRFRTLGSPPMSLNACHLIRIDHWYKSAFQLLRERGLVRLLLQACMTMRVFLPDLIRSNHPTTRGRTGSLDAPALHPLTGDSLRGLRVKPADVSGGC